MSLDDADTIRRFLSQIKGQPERSNSTSPLSTQYGQVAHGHGPSLDADGKHVDQHNTSEGAKTPPHATLASQDHDYSKSPEAHPKPSPHISGLKAPQNTPKTAASSPRLQAGNTHNEDVAEAFSDYVNSMQGRPLSESMWATGSARYKPSMLSGARSATIFTPIKAVEPNSTINDTFDRMSFKAAESDGKADENLVGDRVTQSLYSKAPPSSANKFSILADTIYRDTVDDVQAKREAASDGGSGSSAQIDTVKKENDALSTSKEYVPPHLRATRSSSPKSDSSTRVPGVESTVTTAGSKPLKRESENEDLKHKTFFDAWPKLEERSKPGIFSTKKLTFQRLLTHPQPPRYARLPSKTSLVARQLPSYLRLYTVDPSKKSTFALPLPVISQQLFGS